MSIIVLITIEQACRKPFGKALPTNLYAAVNTSSRVFNSLISDLIARGLVEKLRYSGGDRRIRYTYRLTKAGETAAREAL